MRRTYSCPMNEISNDEVWKAVPGFTVFEISDLGRVRRIKSCRGTPTGLKRAHKGPDGYWRISLVEGGKERYTTLHRLVLCAFVGDPPTPDHCAAHNDGDKDNNRLNNLRWATYAENEDDKRLHGTETKGERNGSAKLTREKVLIIRAADLSARGSLGRLANEFGVVKSVICNVRAHRTWAHV
jgi:hypothetical protein